MTRANVENPTADSTVRIELRTPLPLLGLGFLLVIALLLPDRVWNTLLIGFGGMYLLAYLWARLLAQGLHAARRLQFGWVSVGDRLAEAFEIHNRSPLPVLWVEVLDKSNVPGYQAGSVRSLGENQVSRWRQTAVCQRRGQFKLGPWAIRSGDPLGLFTVTRRYPHANEIIIHPPIHGELPLSLPAGQSSGEARVKERAWRATLNAASVRAYQTNDPYHWIHWPTSARKGALFVRQFDRDVSGDIWLLLDLQEGVQLGGGPEGTEEHMVLLAASLGARALHENRAVGVAAYGRSPQLVPPGRGEGHQWKLLRALALMNADGRIPLARALQDLAHTAKRGATAVIITPRADADWFPQLLTLAQQRVQGSVILLDRSSFDDRETGSSEAMRQAILRLGFDCHIIRQGDLGQPIEEQARRGFWEFKVTKTGKVVTVQNPYEQQAQRARR